MIFKRKIENLISFNDALLVCIFSLPLDGLILSGWPLELIHQTDALANPIVESRMLINYATVCQLIAALLTLCRWFYRKVADLLVNRDKRSKFILKSFNRFFIAAISLELIAKAFNLNYELGLFLVILLIIGLKFEEKVLKLFKFETPQIKTNSEFSAQLDRMEINRSLLYIIALFSLRLITAFIALLTYYSPAYAWLYLLALIGCLIQGTYFYLESKLQL